MSETEILELNELSEKLKQAREAQGFSIETVAEKLNLSQDQLTKLESLHKEVSGLTPFERGYIRSYAHFLNVDLSSFESQFPDGTGVGSELHPVERYSYKVDVPLMSRKGVKLAVYLILFILFILFVSSLDISFDDFDMTQLTPQETSIALPEQNSTPATPVSK